MSRLSDGALDNTSGVDSTDHVTSRSGDLRASIGSQSSLKRRLEDSGEPELSKAPKGKARVNTGKNRASQPLPATPSSIFSCALCDVANLRTARSQVAHERGQRHKKNLAAPPAHGGGPFRCGICNVSAVSTDSYAIHVGGSVHDETLQRLYEQELATENCGGCSRRQHPDPDKRNEEDESLETPAIVHRAPKRLRPDQSQSEEPSLSGKEPDPVNGTEAESLTSTSPIPFISNIALSNQVAPEVTQSLHANASTELLERPPAYTASTSENAHALLTPPEPPNTTMMGMEEKIEALRKFEAEAEVYTRELENLTAAEARIASARRHDIVQQLRSEHDRQVAALTSKCEQDLVDEEHRHARAVKMLEQSHSENKRSISEKNASVIAEHKRRLDSLIASTTAHDDGALQAREASRRAAAAKVKALVADYVTVRLETETLFTQLKDASRSAEAECEKPKSDAPMREESGWASLLPPPPPGSWGGQRTVEATQARAASREQSSAASACEPSREPKKEATRLIRAENLPLDFTCENLFNLFCIYADPVAVSQLKRSNYWWCETQLFFLQILFIKSNSALVEVDNPDHVSVCVRMLHKVEILGKTMVVSASQRSSKIRDSLPDGAKVQRWSHPHHLHRFRRFSAASARAQCQIPVAILHGWGPRELEASQLNEVFASARAPNPLQIDVSPKFATIEFGSTSDAVLALSRCNHILVRGERLYLAFRYGSRVIRSSQRSPTATRDTSEPLPRGWEQQWDPKARRVYYFNRDLGASRWDVPETSKPEDSSRSRARAQHLSESRTRSRSFRSLSPQSRRGREVKRERSRSPCQRRYERRRSPSPPVHRRRYSPEYRPIQRSLSPRRPRRRSTPPPPPSESPQKKHAGSPQPQSLEAEDHWARGAWSDENEPLEDLTNEPTPKRPHEHHCPVSLEVMKDPVLIVTCGCTLDKCTAEKWFAAENSTCPACGQDSDGNFKENKAVRIMINDWNETYGDIED